MQRIHRSIVRRANKIDATKIANFADEYLEGYRLFKKDLEKVPGLKNFERVKKMIKKIDDYEKEIVKLEDKIEKMSFKRGVEAVKLEQLLSENLGIVEDYLDKDELRDFWA